MRYGVETRSRIQLLIIFCHIGINYDGSENKKHFNFRPKLFLSKGATCEELKPVSYIRGFLYAGSVLRIVVLLF